MILTKINNDCDDDCDDEACDKFPMMIYFLDFNLDFDFRPKDIPFFLCISLAFVRTPNHRKN